jgi:hypothetical protein
VFSNAPSQSREEKTVTKARFALFLPEVSSTRTGLYYYINDIILYIININYINNNSWTALSVAKRHAKEQRLEKQLNLETLPTFWA